MSFSEIQRLIREKEKEVQERMNKDAGGGGGGSFGSSSFVALQDQIDNLETASGSFATQQDLTDLQTAFQAALDAEIAETEAEQAAQDARLATNEGDIDQNEQDISDNEDDIDANTAADASDEADTDAEQATQDGRLSANEGAISALQTATSQNSSNISSLDTALTSETTSRVAADDALDARIDALENAPSDDDDPSETVVTSRGTDVDLSASLAGKNLRVPEMFVTTDEITVSVEPTAVINVRANGVALPNVTGSIVIPNASEVVFARTNNTPQYLCYYRTDQDLTPLEERVERQEIVQREDSNLFQNGGRTTSVAFPYDVGQAGLDFDPATDSPNTEGVITLTGPGASTYTVFYEGDNIPVNSLDPREGFKVFNEARLAVDADGTGARLFMGFRFRDKDGLQVNNNTSQYNDASITTLAADLNPGDTTVTVADASGWLAIANNSTVVLADYTDSSGYNWGPRGYSRDVGASNNAIDSIAGNVITLEGPWDGPAGLAGRTVRQSIPSGGTFRFVGFSGDTLNLADGWQFRSGVLGPSTEFSNVGQSSTTDNLLSGAVEMIPVILTRSVPSDYRIDLGEWSVEKLDIPPVFEEVLRPNAVIRASNLDIATNLNNPRAANTLVPIFGTVEILEGGFTVLSPTEMSIDIEGRYKVRCNIFMVGNTARQSVHIRLFINGAERGTIGATGYIRLANAQNEASVGLQDQTFEFGVGDTISLKAYEEGATNGAVDMGVVGASFIEVERIG